MKKYNIENPADSAVSIVFKGIEYKIESHSTLKNVPEEVAIHWSKNIHQFLKLSEVKEAVTEKIKEAIKQLDEIKDEVVAEVVEKKIIKNKK